MLKYITLITCFFNTLKPNKLTKNSAVFPPAVARVSHIHLCLILMAHCLQPFSCFEHQQFYSKYLAIWHRLICVSRAGYIFQLTSNFHLSLPCDQGTFQEMVISVSINVLPIYFHQEGLYIWMTLQNPHC